MCGTIDPTGPAARAWSQGAVWVSTNGVWVPNRRREPRSPSRTFPHRLRPELMNLARLLVRGLRAYFWLVLGGLFVAVLWGVNAYVIDLEGGDIGWVAIAGFGAIVSIFLFAIRRLST